MQMTRCRKVLAGIAIALVVIQFYRPARNESAGPFPNDVLVHHETPQAVKEVLVGQCYDCHSDNTRYPWYSNIQPVGLWMDWHVREGRKHLNFSTFATYSAKRAAHKMQQTREMVEKREMPLPSYAIIHRDAKLTDEQIKLVADWARELEAKLKPTGANPGTPAPGN